MVHMKDHKILIDVCIEWHGINKIHVMVIYLQIIEFCDMCMEKFNNPDKLQQHRVERHSAPTGI